MFPAYDSAMSSRRKVRSKYGGLYARDKLARRFVREHDRWFYVDGAVITSAL